MTDKELILARIRGTDLAQFCADEDKILFALHYAASEVNLRCGFTPSETTPYPPKYRWNVLEGAIWRLNMIGNEGQSSFSENGVSGNYRDVPQWLQSVVPRLGVVS